MTSGGLFALVSNNSSAVVQDEATITQVLDSTALLITKYK
jgi:hypothetical protein